MIHVLRVGVLVSAVLISGCTSTPPNEGDAVELTWSPGVYRLNSSVTYRDDSSMGTSTARMEVTGEVVVAHDGPVSMVSSIGMCRNPDPTATQRDRDRGRRTFLCGAATYYLRPGSEGVQGSVEVEVREKIRSRSRCVRTVTTSSGVTSCAEYAADTRTRETTKTGRVRSQKLR